MSLDAGVVRLGEDTQGHLVDWDAVGPALLLDDARDGVIVERSAVDVFAIARGGRHNSSWTLLGRLHPGSILVGGTDGGGRCIAIRRQPEAVLRRFAVPGEQRRPRRSVGPAPEEGYARGVAQTVRSLDALRGDQLPPRDFEVLGPGVTTLARREVVRPVDTELWTLGGEHVAVHGLAAGVIEPGEWIVLTKDHWVEATARTSIETFTSDGLAGGGRLWQALADHVVHLLRESARVVSTEAAQLRERIERALVRDAATLPSLTLANHRLARGLGGDPEFLGGVGPYAAAMIRVVRAGGRRLTPDPRLRPALLRATSYDEVSATGWLRTRPLRLEHGWWRGVGDGFVTTYGPSRTPCSIVWDGGAPWIHLADSEAARPVEREDLERIRPEAKVVEVPAPSAARTVGDLVRLGLAGSRRDLLDLVGISVAVLVASMLTPIVSGQVMGELVLRAQGTPLVQVGLLLLGVLILVTALQWMQNLLVLRVKGRLVHRMGVGLWGKLLRLPLPFFEARSPGALGTVVLGIRRLNEALSGALVGSTLSLTVVVGNLVVIFFAVPVLGAALTTMLVIVAALVVRLFKDDVTFAYRQYRAQQQANGLTLAIISTISKIRAAGAENRVLSRWSTIQREAFSHTLEGRRVQSKVMIIGALLPPMTLAVLFATALMTAGSWTLTGLLTAIVASQLVVGNVVAFIASIQQLAPVVPVLRELRPILAAEAESGDGKAQPGELSGEIHLREVSFRYGDQGPLVLDRLNLSVHRGEFLAIVGPSGSGKSTILRMLLGFEQPDSGSVLYDGQDLAELDAGAVRRQCGIVLQNNGTLPGSIRDNICGAGEYTDAAVWEAAEMAGMAADIQAMPMKLSTHVPDGAAGLSGGQRQRLMIARALISKPRIVMFDEATSALDNPTQERVTESTRLLNATRIVVAHRLSTIKDADRIVVIDHGRVAEEGTFEQLVEADGVFADMVRTQAAGR